MQATSAWQEAADIPAPGEAGTSSPQGAMSPPAFDARSFDLEQYIQRAAPYLGDPGPENAVFYEALHFGYELHSGQFRKSGAPYISHPCAVADILVHELGFKDPVLLAAALLHDVVEDVPAITIEDIEHRFGSTVAELVDGCTKLTRYHLDKAALKDLTHSKIFLSASRRLGVLIIKLADRLHNLRTLHFLPLGKRQRIAQETVEVYAPIAARLNIFPVKRELYHLALSYLYPKKSKRILQLTRDIRNSSEVTEIEATLQQVFKGEHQEVIVRARAKGLGSYYDPFKRTLDPAFPENHVDFAIILRSDDKLACYTALGIVCVTFPPIPRSLRDFISSPKVNGYRSLHVRCHIKGQNYLIKIRTPEMDQWAAYGILAEWNSKQPLSDDYWHDVSDLLRSIGEYGGAGSQRKALIRLSEAEEIFIYSPKGDIYHLPKGSIVLDFAYKIHSDIGDHCEGAWINNEWAPPTHLLKDGDTVQIITVAEPLDIDPDVEELCRTPKARTAINRHLQRKRIEYAREVGRQILLQEFSRHGLPPESLHGENINFILEFLNIKDLSDLFTRIGQDLLSPHLFLYYFESPAAGRRPPPEGETLLPEHPKNVIRVSALDKGIHKFARCCNPCPCQEGVVATLSERGATFHLQDCNDLSKRHALETQRLLSVEWDKTATWPHPLVFHLDICQVRLSSLLPALGCVPAGIAIQSIQDTLNRHDQPVVRLVASLRGFLEAESLFSLLPADRTVIDYYGREGSMKRVSPL